MIYSVEPTEIPAILIHQLEGFFPLSNEEKNCIKTVWGGEVVRLSTALSKTLISTICHIGDNVTLGAGALVKDTDIPSNSIVFGQSPNLIIKTKK